MATNLIQGNIEHRRAPRDEVLYRTRGTAADGRALGIQIVNISPKGLMARCEGFSFAVGDRLRVRLPVVGNVAAEVRWALGGRIGCELDVAIPAIDYPAVIAGMGGSKGQS
jgi:hypothetical protein